MGTETLNIVDTTTEQAADSAALAEAQAPARKASVENLDADVAAPVHGEGGSCCGGCGG